jgi:predicted aldo/keto reductase-like oxidoreductase
MEYRKLGNTGLDVSVVGFGGEHLDGKPYVQVEETIDAVLENGINIMDIFMPGHEIRSNIGKALGSRRKDVIIQGHICSVDLNQQYDISRDLDTCKRYFDNLLQDLKTDYIDIGMLFFIDSEDDYNGIFHTGIIEYVKDLKKSGVIRAIGASSHNPIMAKKAIETGLVEVLLFSINPAFDLVPGDKSIFEALESNFDKKTLFTLDPLRAELYSLCESRGTGITVMKTFGAGKLLSKEHSPFSDALTPEQCIHYALSRPAVSSVLLGCKSRAEVEAAVKYLTVSDEERDYSKIISTYEQSFGGKCMYCNHCRPCPSDIDIAAVTKYLDIARLMPNDVPPSIVQHYKALSAHGSNCITCGSCQARCPFSVAIIENMKKAVEIFGV